MGIPVVNRSLGLCWLLLTVAAGPSLSNGEGLSTLEIQMLNGEPAGRISAARKIAMEKDPASAASLVKALKDKEPLVKRYAIYGLQRIGDASAAKKVAPLLADKDIWVRRTAATALGKLKARQCTAELIRTLRDASVHVRLDAFIALGRIGDPSAQRPLLAAMKDRRLWSELDVWDQMAILHTIDRPFWTDRGAVPFLRSLLNYDSWPHPEFERFDPERRKQYVLLVSNYAATILASKFGDASGEEWLLKGVVFPNDPYMQQESAKALGAIKSEKGARVIAQILDEYASRTRDRFNNQIRSYIESLSTIGSKEATAVLEKYLVFHDYRVRLAAADALSKIDGNKRDVAPEEPPAVVPVIAPENLATPGGKRPPMFICLGVDDNANLEGLEAMLDICETLCEKGAKAVFTMWVAPLAGDWQNSDMEKKKLIYQRMFDLGCEIAHHTLHHNPGGRNWRSLPREQQVEEIEGCEQWFRDNIVGFVRTRAHRGGGGGFGGSVDQEFSSQLLARRNFLSRTRNGAHPNNQGWPQFKDGVWTIPTGCLDAAAPPVHAVITDPIVSNYPGRFDYKIATGVAMWNANFEYHYNHPERPPLAQTEFHDWGFKSLDDSFCRRSQGNEAQILKEFLIDVLVTNKEAYPDTYCITLSQLLEYVKSGGDLAHTLAVGNCQDSRNPIKPLLE